MRGDVSTAGKPAALANYDKPTFSEARHLAVRRPNDILLGRFIHPLIVKRGRQSDCASG